MVKTIAFDMRMMKPFPTGIGSHYLYLIKSFVSKYREFRYILIISKRGENLVKDFFQGIDVEYVLLDVNGGSIKQFLMFPKVAMDIKRLNADIVITDIWSSLPIMPFKYGLMLYDLIGFNNVSKVSIKQYIYDKFLYKRVVSNAKVIIASTEAVKQDGVKYLGVTPEKIHVVMPSVANEYSDQISDEYINEVLSEYKLERGKYLIYIGNRRPHKNLLIAIKAFSVLMKDNMYKGLKFALVGGYDDEKKREGDGLLDLLQNEYPSIKDSIQILGKIPSNKKVAALLNGSIALFHPSLFEGFGLTPLEAIYSNTIAVVSDIPPIREVLGEAGIYVDPLDANNCAKVLETILDNPEARESYLLKADEVKKRMTWDTTSKQLYEALSCI